MIENESQNRTESALEVILARLKISLDAIANCKIFECNIKAGFVTAFSIVVHRGRGEDAASPRCGECVCNIKYLSLVKFDGKNDQKNQQY